VSEDRGLTERIARACASRPWLTIAAWAVILAGAIACLALVMTGLTTEGKGTNNPQSERAEDRMLAAFPPDPSRAVTDLVVVRSERYTVDDRRFRAFLAGLVRAGRETGAIGGDPTAGGRPPVSADRHAVLLPISITSDDGTEDVIAVVDRADADPDFAVAITGSETRDHDFNKLSERDLQNGELKFGLPAALIVLLLVFGAVVAGLVPLLMAGFSIVAALGLVAILSQPFELSVFIVNMLTGMGLALGIDYSLFVISRYREERVLGREALDAIAASGATASRAVLFSGSAFVIAMFGMLLVPSNIMRSLAAGAILVGITSVAAALTLLPALLGLIRDRVDSLRLPVVGRKTLERTNPEGRFWRRVVDRVLRRPWPSLIATTAVLLLAAAPILGMSIGTAGVSTFPDDLASKRGYIALQRDFAQQTADPVHVVVENASSNEVSARAEGLRNRLAQDERFGPGEIRRAGDVIDLVVPVKGDAAGDSAVAAVRDLRRMAPEMFAGTDADPLVGGTTSENIDYFDNVTNPAPLVFAFVLGLTLVLLTVAFRSIAIALTAIALNLLSVGAAYGLLVLVFQHGVGADLLGFQQIDTIEAWVPLFLFSVLFGLSMDYQVFLLSRIRERYDQTKDTRDAVGWGVASTARIITGAALIIVAVFSGFARGDLVMFQQMGFGVAVALLIDATLVRSVLLPSVMALLGDRSWYLPRWLEWLPRVEVEGHAAPQAHGAEPAASTPP
jgi:RND superfamily putative drug exporter